MVIYMGFNELKSEYYIHNGYLMIGNNTAYKVDDIREIYFKGSFLFIVFKSGFIRDYMFNTVAPDTIDFFQELNREIQSGRSKFSLDVVVFVVLVVITLGLGLWCMLL